MKDGNCPLCEEPVNDYGLVLLFTSRYHVYEGCQYCVLAYCQIKQVEYENENREEKDET
jgi:hypothetical protein